VLCIGIHKFSKRIPIRTLQGFARLPHTPYLAGEIDRNDYENEKTLLRKPSFEDPLLPHLPYLRLAKSAIIVHIFNLVNG